MREESGDIHLWRLCMVWLAIVALLPVISAEVYERQSDFYEIMEQGKIGTAVSFKRLVSKKRAFSSKSGKKGHRRLMERLNGGDGDGILERSGRSLMYANGCSESKNDVSAIVECSNAVRNDPDTFAKDYPCDYGSWRGEVQGKNLVRLLTGSTIQRLAQLHTDDQARMNSMSHTGSDGSDLQTRADRISLPWGAVGENVAVGFTSAKAVVMAWMCSPPHRKNLMSCDFSKIGVGTGVSKQGRHYYTQVFSCDLSEKCGCNASPKPRPKPQPVETRRAPTRPPKVTPSVPSRRPPPPPRHPPPTTTRTHYSHSSSSSYSDGGSAESSSSARAGGSHCDWINSVWTCGSHIRPKPNDPYGRITHRS